jgi:hypothetical protein
VQTKLPRYTPFFLKKNGTRNRCPVHSNREDALEVGLLGKLVA